MSGPEQHRPRVVVIGAGMMGPGIALALALGGHDATLISRTRERADEGLARMNALLDELRQAGLAQPDARASFSAGTDLSAALTGAELVVESGPESLDWKRALFAELDRATPPATLLASNTSSLSITEIAAECANPERVLTTHFWNPPHIMRLVEIVRGERTSDEAVRRTEAVLRACGKLPVTVHKDRPGQLGNRLQHALIREALYIVAEGIATPEDVDLAVKEGFGARLPVYGVFEHMDMVGLDLVHAIQDYVNRDLARDTAAPAALREKMQAGELGVKTGRGFYDWSSRDAQAVRDRRDRFLRALFRSEFM